jgi:hypothetical protein
MNGGGPDAQNDAVPGQVQGVCATEGAKAIIACARNESMANATKQSIYRGIFPIAVVVICFAIQLTLLFYSFSHPSVNDLVTASFLFIMVIHAAVFEYHAHKMKTSSRRSLRIAF